MTTKTRRPLYGYDDCFMPWYSKALVAHIYDSFMRWFSWFCGFDGFGGFDDSFMQWFSWWF